MDLALEAWKARLEDPPPVHQMEKCDALTQVASCEYGLHRLDEEVRRAVRYNHALSCLAVDIDGFSAVNREHGHPRGDRVLQDVASIVSHAIRATDVVARLEGDQFLIIAPRLNAQGANALAERVLTKVRRHRFPMPGRPPIELTATVGTATCGGGPASNAFELLERTLRAIFHGKADGGNQAVNG